MKITDQVKTMADVYRLKGVTEEQVIPFKNPVEEYQKGANAAVKLFLLAEVLNEGWKPDWDDDDEWKYYPYFWMESEAGGGSGFSYDDCDCVGSASTVGSRLVFRTEDLAIYAGRQFEEVYREFMVFQ